jgi:tripartite-type tricarboxylate transporter receptor subunit TctC
MQYARKFSAAAMAAAFVTGAVGAQAADNTQQAYPTKPIRWIVPFAANGGVDVVARMVGQKLGEMIGTTVVVDNRSGGAGIIGAQLAAMSPPDGYTLLSTSSTLSVNQAMKMASGKKPPYDLTKDFAPVMQMTAQPYVLAGHTSVPATTTAELIALAKAKPNTLTIGSSGTGGIQHLAGVLFTNMTGVTWIHIPYKGGGAGHIDLVAGQINLQFVLPLTTYTFVKQGKLRYYGATSLKRMTAFPDVPTIAETVPGYEVLAGYGVVAPAKTPHEIIVRLNRGIGEILRSPEMKGRFANDGMEVVAGSPEAMGKLMANEISKWEKVIRAAGINLE